MKNVISDLKLIVKIITIMLFIIVCPGILFVCLVLWAWDVKNGAIYIFCDDITEFIVLIAYLIGIILTVIYWLVMLSS